MALYVPSSTHWLLCPNHWDEQVKENCPTKHVTGCSYFDDVCELFWGKFKYKRNIAWDPKTNKEIVRSALVFNKFQIYIANVNAEQYFEYNNVCTQTLNAIPPDNEEDVPPLLPPSKDEKEDCIPIILDQVR